MKNIFTVTLPNEKIDNKGVYKNYLLKRLVQSYPELAIDGIDTEENPRTSYQYIGPKDAIRFGADCYSPCQVAKYNKCSCCPFAKKVENYNLATEFELAMMKLDNYAKTQRVKSLYDFRLPDGTPVKEYGNFIQVGYNLIPKYDRGYFSNIGKAEKNIINNIIVVINNDTRYNAEFNF